MSDFWYDPLLHGTGHQQSTSLGATLSTETWPGGGTLGAKTSTAAYRQGLTLGVADSTTTWPPDVSLPVDEPSMIFADGFENQDHAAWAGGAGGRAQDCDCATTCPGGPRDPLDPLDSFVAAGTGYARRVHLRFECKALNASCLMGCEAAKEWPNYKLGETEYLAHRMRIVAPYTPQTDFCLISQFGYCLLKYNALGLNLNGTTLSIYCNLGESKAAPTHYTHAGGWELRDGDHTLTVGAWHDYIWTMTYSTIYGTDGTHTVAGRLRVDHRLPASTSSWTKLYDSLDDFPSGVPTRQWGYNLGGVNEVNNLGKKVSDGTTNQKYYDKFGLYRGDGLGAIDTENDNDLISDSRGGVAASFAEAEQYLDWVGQ